MKQKQWRIIKTIETNGAMQMAIDEAIAVACAEGKVPPTLRFYSFNPPAVTIGYSQKASSLNLDEIKRKGFDLVRRITGGTAVLHKNDLVYSLVIPEEFLPHKVVDAYNYLSDGLISGLKHIGINAEKRCSESKKRLGSCYLNDNPYDVVVNGKKISGNAQARLNGIILQHGTIIAERNSDELVECLNLSKQEKAEFICKAKEKVTSIEEILGKKITFSELETAMHFGFEELFLKKGILLETGKLTEYEKQLAEKFYQEKYSKNAWRDLI